MNDRNKQALLSTAPTRRQVIAGAAMAVGIAATASAGSALDHDGLSHSAEAIHQEPVFKADRNRIYAALTDSAQFNKVTLMSMAMRSGMAPATKATQISREEGGAFVLFGGHIVGRHLELVPNERMVQAWRERTWQPGVYSIVRFELAEHGTGTKIVFDHTGFPAGAGPHLAEGWKQNYWEPLDKFLA